MADNQSVKTLPKNFAKMIAIQMKRAKRAKTKIN